MAPNEPGQGLNGGDETNFDIPENDDLDTIEVESETPAEGATPPSASPAGAGAGTTPTPTTVATQPPPSPSGVVPPAAPAPGAQTPSASPPQQTPQAPTGAAPSPEQPSNVPATFDAQFAANKDQLEAWMAQNLFGLSDADKEELVGSADTFVPKMMAKTLSLAIASVHRQIQQFVPEMIVRGIQNYNTAQKVNKEAEDMFFTRWPGLKGHDAKIEPLLAAFIDANPQATREQVIESVGLLSMHAVGLPLGAPPAQPGRPAQPRQQRQPLPFQPAGGALPGGAASQSDDPWAGFDLPNSD